ncbi:MAG TPA: prepilin-type N-terminal cleavage/methylation domain-containing protein [Mobilitalea sp.]|nr:prepilin-type N-terminal cleavage/methylation domain-containing protein [Mobilitalea sp.]
MKNNNKGVTLIEVIIVISILAILSAGTINTLHRLSYSNTSKAANTISSIMSKLKMETMSKIQKNYLYLYDISGSVYLKVSSESVPLAAELNIATGTKVMKRGILMYKLYGRNEIELEEGTPICISYERSSGRFDGDYEYIKLSNSSNETVIYCVKETGRHWID